MIIPSATLFYYLTRRIFISLAVVLAALAGVLWLFDVIEILRRASGSVRLPLSVLLSMPAFKLPYLIESVLPLAVLFAAIHACWRLNKTSELVVLRASGLSVWQFLSPFLIAAAFLGVTSTLILNPLSAALLSKHERLEQKHFRQASNLTTVSRTGIWLRQPTDEGYALVHAEGLDIKEWRLRDVIVFYFDGDDNFLRRIDSSTANLRDGYWDIHAPVLNDRRGVAETLTDVQLPTLLTAQKIEESFAAPETTSFWSIPEYIRIMEESGFPTIRLSLQFNRLLAQPLLFSAMIVLAAAFSLRPPRQGGTAYLVLAAVGLGFFMFFLQSLLTAFGISQKIPAFLAAWSPGLIGILLGGTILLHLEDG